MEVPLRNDSNWVGLTEAELPARDTATQYKPRPTPHPHLFEIGMAGIDAMLKYHEEDEPWREKGDTMDTYVKTRRDREQ